MSEADLLGESVCQTCDRECLRPHGCQHRTGTVGGNQPLAERALGFTPGACTGRSRTARTGGWLGCWGRSRTARTGDWPDVPEWGREGIQASLTFALHRESFVGSKHRCVPAPLRLCVESLHARPWAPARRFRGDKVRRGDVPVVDSLQTSHFRLRTSCGSTTPRAPARVAPPGAERARDPAPGSGHRCSSGERPRWCRAG